MKLTFSTLGCPGWTFDEIFATAKDLKLTGIELRGIGEELFVVVAKPFSPEHLPDTMAKLKSAGMEIPIISTSACIGVRDGLEQSVQEAVKTMEFAAKIGTPYIRVMITKEISPTSPDLSLARTTYKELSAAGQKLGVTPLIETNDVLADSDAMLSFVDGIEGAGVLWDVHHPYRFFGETPEHTYNKLGALIKHVHVKDSVMEGGNITYKMMGCGDVPVKAAVSLLEKGGYNGYVSLEWVKRWNKQLEDPGVVFYHFVNYFA